MGRTKATDLCVIAALLLAGCADDSAFTLTPTQDWATEAEYEIGDQVQGDEFFGPYLDIRAAADGSRIYVLDLQASEVTIWTPDGALVRRLGRAGGGPGEFQGPGRLGVAAGGFDVRDRLRITTFTLDGELTGTRPYPLEVAYRDFQVQVRNHFNDGSFAALPSPAFLGGSPTSDPTEDLPVLRIVEEGGAWRT